MDYPYDGTGLVAACCNAHKTAATLTIRTCLLYVTATSLSHLDVNCCFIESLRVETKRHLATIGQLLEFDEGSSSCTRVAVDMEVQTCTCRHRNVDLRC